MVTTFVEPHGRPNPFTSKKTIIKDIHEILEYAQGDSDKADNLDDVNFYDGVVWGMNEAEWIITRPNPHDKAVVTILWLVAGVGISAVATEVIRRKNRVSNRRTLQKGTPMSNDTTVVTDVPAKSKRRITRSQLKAGAKYTALAVVSVMALDSVRKRVRKTPAGNIVIDPSITD